MKLLQSLFLCAMLLGAVQACGPAEGADVASYYASELLEFSPGPGAGFGQDQLPDVVFGPPDGRGPEAGGLDVLSLGQGGSIVLGFGVSQITDGPGDDFIVFENPFWPGGDSSAVFAELGQVAVSVDGEVWIEFPCDIDTRQGCAGWRPPLPYDPELILPPTLDDCGGDGFDLAALGLAEVKFVRITDLGENDVSPSAGFDLDAIGIIHRSTAD